MSSIYHIKTMDKDSKPCFWFTFQAPRKDNFGTSHVQTSLLSSWLCVNQSMCYQPVLPSMNTLWKPTMPSKISGTGKVQCILWLECFGLVPHSSSLLIWRRNYIYTLWFLFIHISLIDRKKCSSSIRSYINIAKNDKGNINLTIKDKSDRSNPPRQQESKIHINLFWNFITRMSEWPYREMHSIKVLLSECSLFYATTTPWINTNY